MKKLTFALVYLLLICPLLHASGPSSSTHTWIGTFSNVWDLPGNWSPASVPQSTDDVIIMLGTNYAPVISKNNVVVCRNITIQPGTSKSTEASSRAFIVSNGTTIIGGNVLIKPNATVIITSTGAATVLGDLTINTGGNLTVESGGSLITNQKVYGSAFINRDMVGGLHWHLLSSPVDAQEIMDGEFAPLSIDFRDTPSTCFDFYKLNPSSDPIQWVNLRNANLTVNNADFGTPPRFIPKQGYLVAYDNSCLPKTKQFVGNPNTGDQNFILTSGTGASTWNLLGNPFPSAIKWSDVLGKANLASGYYYVWNEEKSGGPGYEAFLDETHSTAGVDGNIPAMQGFMVKTGTSQNSFLTVLNSARVHDQDYWVKSTRVSTPNKLILTVSSATNYDAAYLLFEQNGSTGLDWYDAEKMLSMNDQIPQIYTIVDNQMKTLVNSMPLITGPVTIPVGVVLPSDGNFSITVSGLENFSPVPEIILEDMSTGNTQNINSNAVYSFSGSRSDAGDRFLLHFLGTGTDPRDSNPISIYSYGHSLYISSSAAMQNSQLTVTNMIGQQILKKDLNNQVLNEVPIDVREGYYLVRVQTQDLAKTTKLYIK